MCDRWSFKFIYNMVMEYIMDLSQVCIIYYENNPDACIKNIHRENLEVDIKRFSGRYNDTINYINSLPTDILQHKLSVYNKQEEL